MGLLEGGTQLAESCYHPRGWGHGENKENIIIMPLSYEDENKIVTTVVKSRINVNVYPHRLDGCSLITRKVSRIRPLLAEGAL